MKIQATLLAMIGLPALLGAGQGETPPSEYEVKAAYLLNFARFVEWPTGAFAQETSPVVLGVLGRDPFGNALDRILGAQKIGGRSFEIRRAARLQELGTCHILFISASEGDRMDGILSSLRGQATLTIADMEKFAPSGGVIGFFTEEKRVRFEANPAAAQRAGIKLSSKLLKLARIVKEE